MKITVEGISKRFGQLWALKDINLEFGDNKIYGLLGRNGAGKTTLLDLMAGRIYPNDGAIKFDGMNTDDGVTGELFYMSAATLYPEGMRVRGAMEFANALYPGYDAAYAKELCERFKLSTRAKIKGLSTGYKTICKCVIALASNAPFVVYDEPALGLDANHRMLLYQCMIENYAQHPKTIIISTHLREEAAHLIEEAVILDNGAVIYHAPVETLLSTACVISGPAEAVDGFCSGYDVYGEETLGGFKAKYLAQKPSGQAPDDVKIGRPELQKLFVQMTGSSDWRNRL